MSIVFIDTQIMIWAVLGQAKEDQKFLIPKAKHLISELEKQKADLYISSVTLAEMLCGVPKSAHNTIRREIQRVIKVAPFDSLGAKHYGKIWRETKADGLYDELMEMGMVRRQFKADCTILGTALATKADKFYTYDNKFNKLAGRYLLAPDMPTIPAKEIPLPIDGVEDAEGQDGAA